MNLGEQLKANLQKSIEDQNRDRLEQEARENEEKRRQLEQVQEYFWYAIQSLKADILAGRKPVPVPMDKRGERWQLGSILNTCYWNDPSRRISDKHHPYYSVWAEFAGWARENGLQAKLIYAYDGGGVESWNLVTVEPLP